MEDIVNFSCCPEHLRDKVKDIALDCLEVVGVDKDKKVICYNYTYNMDKFVYLSIAPLKYAINLEKVVGRLRVPGNEMIESITIHPLRGDLAVKIKL